jgi:DNA-binding CsgD family transcriptional regulator
MGTGDLRSNEFHLTSRQVEVLDLLARGRTNPQIAEALGISLPGAKWHVSEVMNKLGAASREEAVAAWREHQRIAARAARAAKVLLPAVALKSLLLATGAATTATAIVVAAVVLSATEPAREPREAAVSSSSTVPPEVEQRAKALIAEVMAPYPVRVLPPGTRAATPVPGSRFPGHRPAVADDYVAVEAQFIAAATSVETNVSGEQRELPEPRDVWVVRPALQPPWERGQQAEAEHLVVFDAASGELITG